MNQSTGVGFRSERGPLLIALMMTTGLVAIDSTILATAVPSIVGDLGGFSQFTWLFSIYLLAQAVTVPVYAKLADTFGRKPRVMIGIGLFLLGSILCGFAWSLPALIVFRAVQGLGAGAVQPMAITIAGDIYTVAERARVQGYLASVWAVSAVLGPALGGLFSQYVSWRWIFLVNIPLCLLAAWLIARNFTERVERRTHRIDVAGAVTLTLGLSLVILAVLEGGQAWAWDSVQSLAAFALGALLLASFALIEQRAAEPVLSPWVFSRRLLITTTVVSLGGGAILIGLTSFVPTFLEIATGSSPLLAGLALAALTIGWPISASLSGRFYLRLGFRPTVLIGMGVALLGTAALTISVQTPSIALVALSCFLVGLGLGLAVTPSLIAAQSSVQWNERGVVTGVNLFARAIGSAVGVAVFGAIANGVIARSGAGERDPGTIALASGIVFAAVAVCAALTLAAAAAMPKAMVADTEIARV
jgi:EmrB/QacA subfamily drug resistance transporter